MKLLCINYCHLVYGDIDILCINYCKMYVSCHLVYGDIDILCINYSCMSPVILYMEILIYCVLITAVCLLSSCIWRY